MWAFLWEGEEAGFWRVTGQQAQRDPDGLSQSRAGIDKGGVPYPSHLRCSCQGTKVCVGERVTDASRTENTQHTRKRSYTGF